MSRPPEWYPALLDVVTAHQRAPWERGKRDCGTFAADCLVAIGAPDPMHGLRGAYGTRMELSRLILGRGSPSLLAFVEAYCDSNGFAKIHPMFAQCGDLGFTDNSTACIRMPSGFLAMAEGGGLSLVNPVHAWAIQWE